MAGKSPSADGGQGSSTQRKSTESSLSPGTNEEEEHWHAVVQNNCPVRYRDQNNTLQKFRSLRPNDVILLMTPVVPQRPNTSDDEFELDPYEYLGRALLSRHQEGEYIQSQGLGEDPGSDPGENLQEGLDNTHRSRQKRGGVRHVSYTDTNRITSTHTGFMRLADLVIVVVNNDSEETHPHFHAANIVERVNDRQFGDKRGLTVVLTNSTPGAFELYDYEKFPTVIQTKDYSKESLDAIAGIIFGEIRAGTESPNPGSTSA